MRAPKSSLALLAALVVLALATARAQDEQRGGEPSGEPRGTVLAIGGGKLGDPVVDRLVELARAKSGGRIVVCPAASERVAGPEVERFRERGALAVEVVDFRTRADAEDVARVSSLASASGIFFTGGDQARLLAVLRGTPALEAMRAAFRRGAVVAGTSAGCAVLGDLAIEGDGEGEPLRGGKAPPVVQGFGFFPGAILDQHFLARRRHARLVAALLEHPGQVGIGVDEEAAIERRPSGELCALGLGLVSVYRPVANERAFTLRLLAPGELLTAK